MAVTLPDALLYGLKRIQAEATAIDNKTPGADGQQENKENNCSRSGPAKALAAVTEVSVELSDDRSRSPIKITLIQRIAATPTPRLKFLMTTRSLRRKQSRPLCPAPRNPSPRIRVIRRRYR